MDQILAERAKDAINKKLPVPCGTNCPVVCCEPIITGAFMPQSLLFTNNKNYMEAKQHIESVISDVINTKTLDNQNCFKFEGVVLTEIDIDNGFVQDADIEKMVLDKVKGKIDANKLHEYVNKIKERFKELNIGIITLFSCPNYDLFMKKCTIYDTRPQLCRSYHCEQLNPEKINFSFEEMVKRITIKKEQREYVIENKRSEPLDAIKLYLSGF